MFPISHCRTPSPDSGVFVVLRNVTVRHGFYSGTLPHYATLAKDGGPYRSPLLTVLNQRSSAIAAPVLADVS